jgi:hypothetical protein
MAILGTCPNDGRTYGGYVAPADDRYPNDPAADSMEAMQEYRERQQREAAGASPELLEEAAQLVASDCASTIESAVWAITHKAGYVHGRSDAQAGRRRDITGASEGYAAGYASGYRWGIGHPLPVLTRS